MTKDITFSLPAEAMQGASEAVILGDFNNWDPGHAPKLVKQEDGSFSVVLPLEEGETYRYRFLLDNEIWVNDYNAQRYEPAPGLNIDNCVITVTESPVEENRNEIIVAPKRTIKKADKPVADKNVKPAKASKKAGSKTSKAEGEKKAKAKAAGEKAPKSVKPKPVKNASLKTEE